MQKKRICHPRHLEGLMRPIRPPRKLCWYRSLAPGHGVAKLYHCRSAAFRANETQGMTPQAACCAIARAADRACSPATEELSLYTRKNWCSGWQRAYCTFWAGCQFRCAGTWAGSGCAHTSPEACPVRRTRPASLVGLRLHAAAAQLRTTPIFRHTGPHQCVPAVC